MKTSHDMENKSSTSKRHWPSVQSARSTSQAVGKAHRAPELDSYWSSGVGLLLELRRWTLHRATVGTVVVVVVLAHRPAI